MENGIDAVFQELTRTKSTICYAGTKASLSEVCAWEEREGLVLPPDYVRYLTTVGECRLHGDPDDEDRFTVRLFPLSLIRKYTEMLKFDIEGVESWYAIADAHDSYFIVMDMSTVEGNAVDIIDGCWEFGPHAAIISKSFTEFLSRSLADAHPCSGSGDVEKGIRYWSTPGGYYGDANQRRS